MPSFLTAISLCVVCIWNEQQFQLVALQTNTYQCILATNGADSYAIFLYADGLIQWTTGDANGGSNGTGGTPAKAGFNAGNGINYTTVPGSQTSEIINITSTSNVQVSGMWVFKITTNVTTATNDSGMLHSLGFEGNSGVNYCCLLTYVVQQQKK